MFKIILRGNDLTDQIKDWSIYKANNNQLMASITYKSDKKYHRPLNEWKIEPYKRHTGDLLLYNKINKRVQNIKEAFEIGNKYYIVRFIESNEWYIMLKSNNILSQSTNIKDGDIYKYFLQVAKERMKVTKGKANKTIAENVLNQFDKLLPYNQTCLNAYLTKSVRKTISKEHLIFPFGINETQMEAVSNAFKSQISIIEGPPGTGKTQTILNILANIIINGETCAIVSNNNSAVKNVYEKLEKVNLDFLIAKLGNWENKEDFFKDIEYKKPTFNSSSIQIDEITVIKNNIENLLSAKNDLARLNSEIEEIKIEKEYLLKWQQDHPEIKMIDINKYHLSTTEMVHLLVYIRRLSDKFLSFIDKFNLLMNYRIIRSKFLNDLETRQNFVFSLQFLYYEKLLYEKDEELKRIKEILDKEDFEFNLKSLKEKSMAYLYDYIIKKFPNDCPTFDIGNYNKDFSKFLNYFPIIGSSTHSLMNSIGSGYILDYVIIDEASQQDIIPGILCFGCAKNIIIVGDRKQLPHIPIKTNIKCPDSLYDCENLSLLDSLDEIFKDDVPRTLLKEHYRCHPKIIQFCNKEFYNNQLIPMKNDMGENALSLIVTSMGNHTRNLSNLREIESYLKVNDEIFSVKGEKGFIAPYNAQVDLACEKMPKETICSTIHKFQGRECDEIVFSTVLDKKKSSQQNIDFVDNPSLINVAVSRAINKFTLVTGNNVFLKNNKHLAALIRYIKYYANEDQTYDSPVISAFDLLYTEYDKSLEKLNSKLRMKDSKFKSEQIVAAILRDILKMEDFNFLTFHMQIYLKQLVSVSRIKLTSREIDYIHNNASCDFVIYYKIGKSPFTVIEVDGGYHNQSSQIERDQLKNSILEKAGIPLLRLPTISSEVREKIILHFINLLNK